MRIKKDKIKNLGSKIKVGVIGCGVIGLEIAKACQDRFKRRIELVGVCDIDEKKAEFLNGTLKKKAPILKIDELIRRASLVIESANAKIAGDVVEKVIKKNRSCLVMSVGGLLGKEALLREAERSGVKIYIPSGAVCGIDGLKSASVGKLYRVTLTTKKPPKALEGAPYLNEKKIDLSAVRQETVIFEGNAKDAIKGFPQNVNVCGILSLAGQGEEITRVRIMTSPDYTKNIHEIEIEGDFGRITTRTENVPSEANPKTSQLAVFSAIATLEGITKSVRVGT